MKHNKSLLRKSVLVISFFLCSGLLLVNTKLESRQNALPVDISCFIIDLKVDEDSLKILEFGEITQSRFKGYDVLYGEGKMWENLWELLKQYDIPLWYVGRKLETTENKNEIAFEHFIQFGGESFESLDELELCNVFQGQSKEYVLQTEKGIENYEGIVLFRDFVFSQYLRNKLKRAYPRCLILNNATHRFVNNKYETAKLFGDDKLKTFKPQWRAYKKIYTLSLAQTIIDDFGCDTFVIKPLSCANGCGVIIVDKENLDETLKIILKRNKEKIIERGDSSYFHWLKDRKRYFLIEKFEQSKSITVEDREYDATMRMVVLLSFQNDDITVSFLGGYWKLPLLSLSEEGSFMEKHKSKINNERVCSAKISDQIRQKVEEILRPVLSQVYKKMIILSQQSYSNFFSAKGSFKNLE